MVNQGASRNEPQPQGFALLLLLQGGTQAVLAALNMQFSITLISVFRLPTGNFAAVFGALSLMQGGAPMLGGYLADRVMNPRKVMLAGGALATLGATVMCLGERTTLIVGMVMCAVGGALIKPCLLVLLGSLYRQGDARRDSGFTWMYTVALGAWALVASLAAVLRAAAGWWVVSLGAAFGMLAVTVVAAVSQSSLPAEGYVAGAAGVPRARLTSRDGLHVALTTLGFAAVVALVMTVLGVEGEHPASVSRAWGAAAVLVAAAVMIGMERARRGSLAEARGASGVVMWQRLTVLLALAPVLMAGSLAGAVLDTWEMLARLDHTELAIGQGTVALFVAVAGVVLALVWRRVDASERRPSAVMKIVAGLLVAMVGAGMRVTSNGNLWPVGVLLASNLLMDLSHLIMNPVGQALVTKLAPARSMTMAMAAWMSMPLVASALAGLLLDAVLGTSAPEPWKVAVIAAGLGLCGALLVALRSTLKRWMHGAEEPPLLQGAGYLYRGDGAQGGEGGAGGAPARWDVAQGAAPSAAPMENVLPEPAEVHAKQMLVGAAWGIGGVVVTGVSLLSAEGGGSYVVAYGAIVYGLVTFIRGLAGWSKEKP
ncbi:Hypothetical protein CAP_0351 [Chondromyces apiculatus DSM 436]|uniref:Major facilitator superfamily (MFS) profile domain-containing protein n=1 Tax=Chondromyces apiculatus DSM 436 TaxID=1192034 RepID=A0A017SVN3_9BACT|nr:Hypothetical protein CAP_0351 [Chondromyces apiculatus DSM 436]